MKLFHVRSIKEIAGKGSLVKSNIIVAACAILIAVNIGVFIFVPKILAPLALILSNVITVILMFIAFQPMNHIMQTALKKKAYIYSETGDYSRAVVSALKEIHGGCGHQELSEDLTFDLYAFMVK